MDGHRPVICMADLVLLCCARHRTRLTGLLDPLNSFYTDDEKRKLAFLVYIDARVRLRP